jgi:hypothetical protein
MVVLRRKKEEGRRKKEEDERSECWQAVGVRPHGKLRKEDR